MNDIIYKKEYTFREEKITLFFLRGEKITHMSNHISLFIYVIT